MSHAEYMRNYRAENPDKFEKNKQAIRARDVAMRRLARLHPVEFAELLVEERVARGLPARGTPGRPRAA